MSKNESSGKPGVMHSSEYYDEVRRATKAGRNRNGGSSGGGRARARKVNENTAAITKAFEAFMEHFDRRKTLSDVERKAGVAYAEALFSLRTASGITATLTDKVKGEVRFRFAVAMQHCRELGELAGQRTAWYAEAEAEALDMLARQRERREQIAAAEAKAIDAIGERFTASFRMKLAVWLDRMPYQAGTKAKIEAYATALTSGTPESIAAAEAELSFGIVDKVRRKFAVITKFQASRLGDYRPIGMEQPWYDEMRASVDSSYRRTSNTAATAA